MSINNTSFFVCVLPSHASLTSGEATSTLSSTAVSVKVSQNSLKATENTKVKHESLINIQNLRLYNINERIHSSNLTCKLCNEIFLTTDELNIHFQDKSHCRRVHACELCGKGFAQKRSLSQHYRIHTGEKPFECDLCNKKFNNRRSLNRHQECHIKGKVPCARKKSHACSVCKKMYVSKSGLYQHCLIHTGERHICKICGKKFTQKQSLNEHQLIHTREEPYLCKLCNKRFRFKGALRQHYLCHGRGYYNPLVCTMCGERFVHNIELHKHRLRNCAKMSHICNLCEKAFCTKNDLVAHHQYHTGEKPHICDICDKNFASKIDLSKHFYLCRSKGNSSR